MKKTQETFLNKLRNLLPQHCPCCKHRWFDVRFRENIPNKCTKCVDLEKKHGGIALLSHANSMDHLPLPDNLPKLSQTEEMLIALACPLMTCYRLKGGMIGYKGNCINLPQDLQNLARVLPRSIASLPIIIVCRQDQDSPTSFQDFHVNRANVLQWLRYLIANCPPYMELNIQISEENLEALPVDGNVAHLLPVINKEQLDNPSDCPLPRARPR